MSQHSPITSNRHQRILEIVKKDNSVRVDTLSRLLDVSSVTIRRDLDTMDRIGLIMRTHGGARKLESPAASQPESTFFEKGIINIDEKYQIARMAVNLVQNDDIVFLNSGTTTLCFLEVLKTQSRIITNNAASIICNKDPKVELLVLGGEYRERSRSFVGDFALNAIKGIHSKITILGVNGLSQEKGLTTSVISECSINQSMIENTTGHVIVLADYSKIDHISNFVSSPIESIDILITDNKAPEKALESFKSKGIEVIIA